MIERAAIAPTGVRLSYRDGKIVPTEVFYSGFEDGTHFWQTVECVQVADMEGLKILIDELPAHSALGVTIVDAEPEAPSPGDPS